MAAQSVWILQLPPAGCLDGCLPGAGEAAPAGGIPAAASVQMPAWQLWPVKRHVSCFSCVHSPLFCAASAPLLLLLPSCCVMAVSLRAGGSSVPKPWQLLASSRHSSCSASVCRQLLLHLLCLSCIRVVLLAYQFVLLPCQASMFKLR